MAKKTKGTRVKTAQVVDVGKPAAAPAARPPMPPAQVAKTERMMAASPAAANEDEAPRRNLGPLVRVRATRMGFVDNVRRREGDVFDVHQAEFTEKWMEVVDGKTPPRSTTGKQELERKHDETLAEKARIANDPLGS